MSVNQIRSLLDRLSGLVAQAEPGQDANLPMIVGVIQEIRKAIGTTGELLATNPPRRQEITTLFSESSQHLTVYRDMGGDPRQLREAFAKLQTACSLAETVGETAAETLARTPESEASYEILGKILIVGSW